MGRKKTHEEYIQELKDNGIQVEAVETYVNAKTPILHRCLIHDVYWKVSPTNVLSGKCCSQCAKEKRISSNIKTHEQYVNELKNINPDIIVLGKYVNAKTKIIHKCLKHNMEWESSPNTMLKGRGCPQCAKEKRYESRAKSHEEYVSELKIANSNIIAIDKYKNYNTPITHKCLKHDIEWIAAPSSVLHGRGCPQCKSEKIAQKTGDRCRKTHIQYIQEVQDVNPDIIVLGIYIGANIPILHKCKKDGYEWMAAPSRILYGYWCPVCQETSGERKVRQHLEKNKIKYEFQKTFKDCKDINALPFDFYLPEYNTAIEFNGQQHYESVEYFGGEEKFKTQQKHDQIKRDYCNKNNIKLLEIRYDEDIEEKLNNFLFI